MLVPGGLGFIGSHTVLEILEHTAASVVIVDDLSNCFGDVLERMQSILEGKIGAVEVARRLRFHQGSILDL